jgi:hypothetical protein
MGANITPTMKNSGRTVFGVKMGLSRAGQPWSSAANYRVTLHVLPCFQALLPECRVYTGVIIACPRATRPEGVAYSEASCSSSSWFRCGPGPGSISNRCVRPAVFATWQLFPRESAKLVVWEECGRRSLMELRNAADERLSLAKPHPDLVTCRATQPWILQVPAHGVRAPDFTMQGLESRHDVQHAEIGTVGRVRHHKSIDGGMFRMQI